jgi:hypothetical protein
VATNFDVWLGGRPVLAIRRTVETFDGWRGGRPILILGTARQSVTPDATLAAGGWLDQSGSAADLAAPLADESTSTWIQSAANPSSDLVKLRLTDPLPLSGGDIVVVIDAEQV